MNDNRLNRTPLEQLLRALRKHKSKRARRLLAEMHPAEIALLLEALPPNDRTQAWELVSSEKDAEVLLHVNDEVRSGLMEVMNPQEWVAATKDIDIGDLADLVQDMPESVSEEFLAAMNEEHRRRLEEVLSYPEDSAGGLMRTDQILVRADVTLDVVLRYLRRRGEIPTQTNALFVTDRNQYYLGVLRLRRLLTNDPELTVGEVMEQDIDPVPVDTDADELVKRFEQRDLISAPVVDPDGILVGRIVIDDIVDLIRDQAEHSLMSMAGLDEEEDMFAPVVISAKRRALWLGINLVTAFMAAWVIGLFEQTLSQIVALAVLMPIVASMGGIAGSQTLTLIIRGLALGQVEASNARILLIKELAVSCLNGLLWAFVIALLAVIWFGSWAIGAIIAAAIAINLLAAALAGVVIPLLLRWLQIDPALAGGVILTTVTDIVGFFAFLGLATAFLL